MNGINDESMMSDVITTMMNTSIITSDAVFAWAKRVKVEISQTLFLENMKEKRISM